MKKKFLFLMMVFAILFVSSCQNDLDLGVNVGKTSAVSFSINTPDIATRAYSDGTTATHLQYAVYDAEGNELEELTVTNGEIHGSATVTLQLITGNKYSVIFWASAPNAPYTVDFGTKSMTVDYDNAVSNDENRDAFYKYHEFTVNGPQTEAIELKRPFAQFNIGTNDYAEAKKAGYVPTKSAVTVKNIYNTLNLATGVVSNPTKVTYGENEIPANESFAVQGYEYLAMNYLLVAADKEVVDVEFTCTDGSNAKTRTVGSVPVQRNYRTNIYGQLLTSDVDVKVNIASEYDGTENMDVIYLKTLPDTIQLNSDQVFIFKDFANYGINLLGTGTLILDNSTIKPESGPAISLADNADVTLKITNEVTLEGASDGIQVPSSAKLTINGLGNLKVVGSAGSGIGLSNGSAVGTIHIDGLAQITAKGNGNNAFGIGGNGSSVVVKNSTIDYACGGHVQPDFINDSHGKKDPEGGAAIGGATIKIENAIVTRVDGGSKAAGIGAQFWQSTDIEIVNSIILQANGGNSSAGIGGSRYDKDSKYDVSIKIKNSTITATGGQYGAGIGSGYDTYCNGHNFSNKNYIEIDSSSVINATGGKYSAGIGTGFHSAYLSGSIAEGATINATSGDNFYKDTYTTAQNVGYGIVDPSREFSGNNAIVTFTIGGNVIVNPNPNSNVNNNQ